MLMSKGTFSGPAMLAEEVVRPVSGHAAGGRIHVTWYTDPLNVWCWGCEPAIRRFEAVYPDAIELEAVMGGLFEDFGPVREYWGRMSGGRWQDSVLAFLGAVADQHRMPMDPDRMMRSVEDLQSTWPGCIAVKAAQAQGSSVGLRYLRAMREAGLADGRPIHHRSVQEEIAKELGLDLGRFAASLDDGSAEAAFAADRERCQASGVTGFPTFEFRYATLTYRVDGWQPWESLDEAVRKLDPGLEPRRIVADADHLDAFLRRSGRSATREVAAVFDLTDDDAEILLEDLEAQGRTARQEAGSGLFWSPVPRSAGAPPFPLPEPGKEASGSL